VGIAIGAGADVALDAADVVLMRSNPADIPAAIRLSRQVLRNIHENLFWAFFYNCIGIPLAAGALIPAFHLVLNPMFGAAAMSLSSFCVVTNALRLNLFDPHAPRHDKRWAVSARSDLNQPAAEPEKKEETAMKRTIHIEGMMCEHCVHHVQTALEKLGVKTEVNLEKGIAEVYGQIVPNDTILTAAVTEAGYKVTGID
jgi:Cu2+-exporting ATPase